MKLMLRAKLIISFLAVIVITGVVATIVGIRLIGIGIVREAQNKVALDLNSARRIYSQRLESIELLLDCTAMRTFCVRRALLEGDGQLLLDSLAETMRKGKLDLMAITDQSGRVVVRAHNPGFSGDSQAGDEIIGRVLSKKKNFSATQIFTREELLAESEELAERARVKILPTPMARPTDRTQSTSGMMLKAAVPVLGNNGEFIGVLYGGVLLNRQWEIVDGIKNVVYRGVKYDGKDIGTATIFQDDLRIATNVKLRDGSRALGTRVSRDVYDRVIGHGKSWTERAFVVNDWYLTAYSPLHDIDGNPIGILYVGLLEKKYSDMKSKAFWIFLGIAAAGAAFAFVVAFWLAGQIAKPVRELKNGVEAIARGNFDYRVAVKSRDEIGMLADSFNQVGRELKETYEKLQGEIDAADVNLKNAYYELREKQEQLVQAERLASMGQLSAGVAHEVNNPLGTILLYSHMLLKKAGNKDPDLQMIVDEATRCRDIVRGLLNFARQSKVTKAPADLHALIRDVVSIMAAKAQKADVALKADFPDELPDMIIDSAQIKQVLVNLVQNGIAAASGGGTVRVRPLLDESGNAVCIHVIDDGKGIPHENISKLFTPFFTTGEQGEGTGLGLAISYGIVKMHSGGIFVESEEGKGTDFIVRLPAGKDARKENRGNDDVNGESTLIGKENSHGR